MTKMTSDRLMKAAIAATAIGMFLMSAAGEALARNVPWAI